MALFKEITVLLHKIGKEQHKRKDYLLNLQYEPGVPPIMAD